MDRSQSSSACRSCRRDATSVALVPGSAADNTAEGVWRSCTCTAPAIRVPTLLRLGLCEPTGDPAPSRAISRPQEARIRLGGSGNLTAPFPARPRGMHRMTYYRLLDRAMAAQERTIALEFDYMRRHYPGPLS